MQHVGPQGAAAHGQRRRMDVLLLLLRVRLRRVMVAVGRRRGGGCGVSVGRRDACAPQQSGVRLLSQSDEERVRASEGGAAEDDVDALHTPWGGKGVTRRHRIPESLRPLELACAASAAGECDA